MALFLAVTLVPAVLLIALGWLLYEQDRATGAQLLADRRGQAADLVVSELARGLSEAQRALEDPESRRTLVSAPDAVIVVFSRTGAVVSPGGRLAYVPVAPPGREADSSVFEPGADLEYPAAGFGTRRGVVSRAHARTRFRDSGRRVDWARAQSQKVRSRR